MQPPYCSTDHVHQAITAAFDVIETVHGLMSFQREDSQLSLLNRKAAVTSVKVHPWVYAVLKRAMRLYSVSQGLFDCTVADVLVDWDFLPHPSDNKPKLASQADVYLLPENRVKYIKPLWLDLSGIAKGFAVDLAILCLKRYGIEAAIVNAGGDLRVIGPAQPISVRQPHDPSQLIVVGELSNGALATSGIYYAKREIQGEMLSHLVNPLTRHSLSDSCSYSVIAPTAWMADGLTKVVAATADAEHPCLKQFSASAFILT